MDNLWTFSACAKTTQTSSTYEAVESSALLLVEKTGNPDWWIGFSVQRKGSVSVSFQVMNPWWGCRLYDYMYFFRHFLVSSADQGVDIKLMTRDYDIWHISEFIPISDFLINSERHPSSSQVWPFLLHYVHCCNNFWLNRVCTVDGRAISSGGEPLKLSSEYLDYQPGVPGFSKDHRCRNGGYHG